MKRLKGNVVRYSGKFKSQNEQKPKRLLKDSVKALKTFDKNEIETIDMGTLATHFREEAKTCIVPKIQQACSAMNQAIRVAEKAARFLLENVMQSGPAYYLLLQDFIGDVTAVDSGESFWTGLLRCVVSRRRNSRSRSRLLQHFLGLEESRFFVIDHGFELEPFLNGRLIEENGSRMAVNCRGAIIGKMAFLIASLLEEGVPRVDIEEIVNMEPAERPVNFPGRHYSRETPDVVVKFCMLNEMKTKPFMAIPQSRVSDSYIVWTEACLLNLMNDAELFQITGIHRRRRDEPDPDREVWLNDRRQDSMEKSPGTFLMTLMPKIFKRCCTIDEKMDLRSDETEMKRHQYILRFLYHFNI